MASLIAKNGRIVFSPAAAVKACRLFQRASPCCRARNAWRHGSSARAIATIVLPQLRFAVLATPVRRGGLSSHAGIKAGAPFQRAVAASIGKSTN